MYLQLTLCYWCYEKKGVFLIDDSIIQKEIWLRSHVEPPDTVKEHWRSTIELRIKTLLEDKLTVDEYFQRYPCLQTQFGVSLVSTAPIYCLGFVHWRSENFRDVILLWPLLSKSVLVLKFSDPVDPRRPPWSPGPHAATSFFNAYTNNTVHWFFQFMRDVSAEMCHSVITLLIVLIDLNRFFARISRRGK